MALIWPFAKWPNAFVSNKLTSVKRTDLISRLKQLGFAGPFSGGKHQFLIRESVRLILPNPHAIEIGPALLARILQQAGLSREEWIASA
jgi:predicted RNA binding protein YcfA (HicA-like mRNA interferase family)